MRQAGAEMVQANHDAIHDGVEQAQAVSQEYH
jgi:hypothetical protein